MKNHRPISKLHKRLRKSKGLILTIPKRLLATFFIVNSTVVEQEFIGSSGARRGKEAIAGSRLFQGIDGQPPVRDGKSGGVAYKRPQTSSETTDENKSFGRSR